MGIGGLATTNPPRLHRRLWASALLLTVLSALLSVVPPSPHAAATGSNVGYLGCSLTWQTVNGYHADGGTRLWPPLPGYGSGEIPKWYNDIFDPTPQYWPIFSRTLNDHPTTVFWFEGCLLTSQISRDASKNISDAEGVINHIRELVPGATVYFSAMNGWDPPDICDKASSAAVARAQLVTDAVVADGVALRGPLMPALPESERADNCHPDASGQAYLGQTLLAWLGEAGPPPEPTFSDTPGEPSQSHVSFSFTDSESGTTFSCSVDGSNPSPCSSPDALTGLPDGSNTFSVEAVDEAGNTSDPATFTWDVGSADTTPPPSPILTDAPSDPSGAAASFSFTDDESGTTFSCSVDGSNASPCSSPDTLTGLPDGSHTFSVEAVDPAGNISDPTTFRWNVDATPPPPPTLLQTPPDPSADDTGSFSFTDDDAASTFICSLDGATPSSCTSPDDLTGLADGSHTFSVRAVDRVGNVSDASTFSWTVRTPDTTPPPAPDYTRTPGDPSSSHVSFSFTDGEGDATFTCSVDGSVASGCSSPDAIAGLFDGPHTFSVFAADRAGNVSDPSTFAWNVDATAPPAPSFDRTPPDPSGASASFSFSDDEASSTFTCSLDGARATACTSPEDLAGLSDGPHAFSVRAIDEVGNTSDPTTFTWTVQEADRTPPPAPTFRQTPPDPSGPDVGFGFADDEADVTFTCSGDGSPALACVSPDDVAGLSDGPHTFSVRAVDPAGNVSDPAAFAWNVDRTPPPAPAFSRTPADPSGSAVSFSFTDGESGATFTCSIDGAQRVPCASPDALGGLADGSHSFSVRALDQLGNVSDPATFTWTVDTTPPPAPRFTQTPADPSRSAASFSFTDDESGATFTCSLDGAQASPCGSPDSLGLLADGSHTFTVRALDGAGNPSAPTSFTWREDTTPPPSPTLTQKPASLSTASVTFSLSDTESGVSYTCAIDGAAPQPCTSPKDYTNLSDGSHTFAARAQDAAGNTSAPTSYTWTVDAIAPTVTMTKPTPDAFLNTTKVTASWTGSDNRGIVRYAVYERIGTTGAQTLVQSSLATSFSKTGALGKTYCYQVNAFDAAGNVGIGEERCQAVPYDDVDAAISYAGSVTRINSANAFQRTLTVLNGAGQQASLTFNGRRVAVLVHKSPSSGKVDIYVDGAFVTKVDLYSNSVKEGVSALDQVLSPGSHTVMIVWTGQKSAASTGTEVDLDAIGVISQ